MPSHVHLVHIELAKIYGLNNSIFINTLFSQLNLFPEYEWFTLNDLESIFTYWSRKTIRRITRDLCSKKLLLSHRSKSLDATLRFKLPYYINIIINECLLID